MPPNFKNNQNSNIGFFAEQVIGDVRFDPSDARPDYIGMHLVAGADTSGTDWRIVKMYYANSASTNTTEVRVSLGSWLNRTLLF